MAKYSKSQRRERRKTKRVRHSRQSHELKITVDGRRAVDEHGKEWISSYEAERVHGLPRELLEELAGEPVRRPETLEDRQLRRCVILKYWSECAGFPLWPARKDDEGAMLPVRLANEVNESITWYTSARHKRYPEPKCSQLILLHCWGSLLELDQQTNEGVWLTLASDLERGQPSQSEIDTEYRRFVGTETDLSSN